MIQFSILIKHVWRPRDPQFAINMYAGVVDLFVHVNGRVDGDAFEDSFEGEVYRGPPAD